MSEGHTDATHCKKCGGWFKAGAGRVFLGGECFHLECAPVPDEKIDMPFMPIVVDEHAFQALRDLARSQADALTAKDAEIERLRAELGSLRTAFRVNMLRFGAADAEINAVLATTAPEPRQDRRSEVPGHQTPASPTGDTRG